LVSNNGQYTLVLQATDGNLVLYAPGGRALWATNRGGGAMAAFQTDGNFVEYSSCCALWASNTVGRGGNLLVVQDDGNLVMYAPGPRAVWATNTHG
jgi:hypothetical protein